jgi:hypothetical protein
MRWMRLTAAESRLSALEQRPQGRLTAEDEADLKWWLPHSQGAVRRIIEVLLATTTGQEEA